MSRNAWFESCYTLSDHFQEIPVVAIVGGGLSGALVATHLLKNTLCPMHVILIERKPSIGVGVAYSTQHPGHLLNVPARNMSAFPDDPTHFLRWLQNEFSTCDPSLAAQFKPETFVPRQIYGDYIQSVLNEAQASAPKYIVFERLNDEVLSLKSEEEGAILQLQSGKSVFAHRVVLALGNFSPANPTRDNADFYSSHRYVRSYFATPEVLDSIDSEATLLLIGSGLTMVDLAIALQARGHRGKIHVVSRRGLLPQIHRQVTPYPPFLFQGEPFHTIRVLTRRVRQEIHRAEAQHSDWRAVIDSLRPFTQELWQGLSGVERCRFLRHVRSYWDAHRHRIAPQVGEKLSQLIENGQLLFHKGHLQGFQEASSSVRVKIQKRHTLEHEFVEADWVFNCTGPQTDYTRLQHPLVVSLLEQGLIHPDPLFLGIETNQDGNVLDAQGQVSPFLFTLGPPQRGRLWETTAVPEIRIQAATLARELAKVELGELSLCSVG